MSTLSYNKKLGQIFDVNDRQHQVGYRIPDYRELLIQIKLRNHSDNHAYVRFLYKRSKLIGIHLTKDIIANQWGVVMQIPQKPN
jgi:hypothetical protein